jgi:phage terminase small subunit
VSLNNKQRAFVEHYLTCWNATEAARRAGYSVKTANEQAARLLANVSVKEAVALRLKDLQAGADEVLTRLTSHSRGNMDDFLSPMGMIDLMKARDLGVMPLVKKIKQRTTTVSKAEGEDFETHEIELELYDAQAATVQMAKILGKYVDRVEHSGDEGAPLTIKVVYADHRTDPA